jgi:hypothetical protein
VFLDLVSLTQGLFFVSALTRNDLEGVVATDVLVVILTGKILGPIPMSHRVHGSLKEDVGHIQLVNDVKAPGPLLSRSEVITFCLVTLRMDAFLSLFLPPW